MFVWGFISKSWISWLSNGSLLWSTSPFVHQQNYTDLAYKFIAFLNVFTFIVVDRENILEDSFQKYIVNEQRCVSLINKMIYFHKDISIYFILQVKHSFEISVYFQLLPMRLQKFRGFNSKIHCEWTKVYWLGNQASFCVNENIFTCTNFLP